jgi:hypothetical protein
MMQVRELFQIELKADEEIVAATYYEGTIIAISNLGTVYKIERTEL